jgi:hypothetical protein
MPNDPNQRRQIAFASSPGSRFRPLQRSVRLLGTHQTDYLYAIAALQSPAKFEVGPQLLVTSATSGKQLLVTNLIRFDSDGTALPDRG